MLAAAGKADQKLSATKWTGDGDFPRLSFPWSTARSAAWPPMTCAAAS